MKPSFDDSDFDDLLAMWEFKINWYERDSNTILTDDIDSSAS